MLTGRLPCGALRCVGAMHKLRKSQMVGLVGGPVMGLAIGLSFGALACSGRVPAAGPQLGTRRATPLTPTSLQPERGESLQTIPPATGSPGPDTPLFEVHASLAPVEHRHFDGKIARIEQLPLAHGWQRYLISVDGNVTRDAPIGGVVEDMPLQQVADKTLELRLPAGVAVALVVGQRLRGSIVAGDDAQPATSRVLLQDDLGPVLALREVPDGFVVQAEPATARASQRVALSVTWPGIKMLASLNGCSVWQILGQQYLLCGYGEVARAPAAASAHTTIVFALLRQPAS